MRIEAQVGVVPVAADSREGKPASASTSTSTSVKPDPSSIVTLSAAGASASSAPDGEVSAANAARITQIREAIRKGQYPIDLDKLASRIVDDEVVRGTAS
ncbi:MAG: flagellar biosynthesis anti-sigma factor FlgM [Kofleriaceae bacterium]